MFNVACSLLSSSQGAAPSGASPAHLGRCSVREPWAQSQSNHAAFFTICARNPCAFFVGNRCMIKMARQMEKNRCANTAPVHLWRSTSPRLRVMSKFRPSACQVYDFARFVFKCLYHTNCAVELAQ